MSAHVPVMMNEVLHALGPQDGEVYVDGTFGAGGYSRAFLESADCTVIAIDQDPRAEDRAAKLSEDFGSRFIFVHGRFGDALEIVNKAGFEKVDGFVLDVGVSSMQIDRPERGFSFRENGPLDMRMDTAANDVTAEKLVAMLPEEQLANIIYQYGEERLSRRVARKIVEARKSETIDTTAKLAEIVRAVVPRSKDGIDPATRTFQALRIAVNDELGELRRGLVAAEHLLKEGGRLVVVSFHSLEDGIVKSFLYERSGYAANASRHMPESAPAHPNTFTLKKRKAIEPGGEEIAANTRSRSAKLRSAVRTAEEARDV
jgi:16S rRNA (cytosine1402-N4)-methyltransferase